MNQSEISLGGLVARLTGAPMRVVWLKGSLIEDCSLHCFSVSLNPAHGH